MITKFTFPSDGRTTLSSVGSLSNGMIKDVRVKEDDMLFWAKLYTTIHLFLSQDIDNYQDSVSYFLVSIDFKCYVDFNSAKKRINIANSFYFYFD